MLTYDQIVAKLKDLLNVTSIIEDYEEMDKADMTEAIIGTYEDGIKNLIEDITGKNYED